MKYEIHFVILYFPSLEQHSRGIQANAVLFHCALTKVAPVFQKLVAYGKYNASTNSAN